MDFGKTYRVYFFSKESFCKDSQHTFEIDKATPFGKVSTIKMAPRVNWFQEKTTHYDYKREKPSIFACLLVNLCQSIYDKSNVANEN